MRLFALLICSTLLLLSLLGCDEENAGADETDEAEVLYFEPIGYGQSGSLKDSTETVIRTQEKWAAYRDSLKPLAPFDSVDFSQAVVLLVALPQTTSGHSIELVAVEEHDSIAVATYVVNIPAEDCLTATAETVPFQAVMVRRTDLPVHFAHETEEYRCTFGRRR